jgi:hypothetical protein
MGLWEKVQKELDRAGSAARGALDEGKLRIELFQVRQQADKAAQALGYAVRRARRDGKDVEAETLSRLDAALEGFEATAKRLEADLAKALRKDAPTESADAPVTDPASDPASDPAADTAEGSADGDPKAS